MNRERSGAIFLTIRGEPASKANTRMPAKSGSGKNQRTIWIKSPKALAYEEKAALQIPRGARQMIEGPVRVTLRMFYASNLSDLDESLVLDVLQARYKRVKGPLKQIAPGEYAHAEGERKLVQRGVYINDRQVKEKHVYHAIDKANPRVEIVVEPMQPSLELGEASDTVPRETLPM